MKSVSIAKFKAELDKYLSFVCYGEEIIILDCSKPFARVIPFKLAESKLIIEEPIGTEKTLASLHFKPISNKKIDSLKFLNEEQGDR